jgi:hypothetical protein
VTSNRWNPQLWEPFSDFEYPKLDIPHFLLGIDQGKLTPTTTWGNLKKGEIEEPGPSTVMRKIEMSRPCRQKSEVAVAPPIVVCAFVEALSGYIILSASNHWVLLLKGSSA